MSLIINGDQKFLFNIGQLEIDVLDTDATILCLLCQ